MRHQESFSRHFKDITNAFSNVTELRAPPQRMTIKSSYPVLCCGRDVLYCQESGAEETEIALGMMEAASRHVRAIAQSRQATHFDAVGPSAFSGEGSSGALLPASPSQ